MTSARARFQFLLCYWCQGRSEGENQSRCLGVLEEVHRSSEFLTIARGRRSVSYVISAVAGLGSFGNSQSSTFLFSLLLLTN